MKSSIALSLSILLAVDYIQSCVSKQILLRNRLPLADCTVGTIGKKPPAFQGIEVDYFLSLAEELGWEDQDWNFECVSESELESRLRSNTSLYVAALGGIRIEYEKFSDGFKFSKPIMNTGLSMLILEERDTWLFLKIISMKVGLAILGTTAAVAIFQFFFEAQNAGLETYIWNAFASIFFVNTVRLYTVPARFLQVAFWFMILIILATYEANMTALVAVEGVLEGIQTAADINSKTVMALEEYEFDLYPFGAKPKNDPNAVNPSYIVDQLKEGNVDGVAVDDALASLVAQENCGVRRMARFFYTFSYGMMFTEEQDPSVVTELNEAVAKLNNRTGSIARLQNYLNSAPKCIETRAPFEDRILFNDMSGIWIIMSATLGISIVLHFLTNTKCWKSIRKTLEKRKILEEMDEDDDKKVGDELIVQNLQEVTQKRMGELDKQITDRLLSMEAHVLRFRKALEEKMTGNEIPTLQNAENGDRSLGPIEPYDPVEPSANLDRNFSVDQSHLSSRVLENVGVEAAGGVEMQHLSEPGHSAVRGVFGKLSQQPLSPQNEQG